MKPGDSEERTLPATEKKLREARKRGQVAHSRELVSAAVALVAMLYVWLGWDMIIGRLRRLLTLPADIDPALPFDQAVERVLLAIAEDALMVVLPLMALAVGTALIAGMAATRGLVLSADPITPKLERLNLVEGLKKVFSLRNLVELAKAIIRSLALLAVAAGLTMVALNGLMQAPSCGLSCLGIVVDAMALPFVAAILAVLAIAALFDIGIQQRLFLRDMRMTKTEMKRERKDLEGDPAIRRVRRQRRNELAQASTPLGLHQATLVVTDGGSLALGLRYVSGKTPVPVLVARQEGAPGRQLLRQAVQQGIPVDIDAELAAALRRKVGLGAFVPRELFDMVSSALVRNSAA